MRSLTLKLTLAFLFVSLIGAVLAAYFVQRRTQTEFDRFLFDLDQKQRGQFPGPVLRECRKLGSHRRGDRAVARPHRDAPFTRATLAVYIGQPERPYRVWREGALWRKGEELPGRRAHRSGWAGCRLAARQPASRSSRGRAAWKALSCGISTRRFLSAR